MDVKTIMAELEGELCSYDVVRTDSSHGESVLGTFGQAESSGDAGSDDSDGSVVAKRRVRMRPSATGSDTSIQISSSSTQRSLLPSSEGEAVVKSEARRRLRKGHRPERSRPGPGSGPADALPPIATHERDSIPERDGPVEAAASYNNNEQRRSSRESEPAKICEEERRSDRSDEDDHKDNKLLRAPKQRRRRQSQTTFSEMHDVLEPPKEPSSSGSDVAASGDECRPSESDVMPSQTHGTEPETARVESQTRQKKWLLAVESDEDWPGVVQEEYGLPTEPHTSRVSWEAQPRKRGKGGHESSSYTTMRSPSATVRDVNRQSLGRTRGRGTRATTASAPQRNTASTPALKRQKRPEWAVDRIVGSVRKRGKLFYEVKWENTLEPAESLRGCADTAIAEFYAMGVDSQALQGSNCAM